MQFPKLIFSDDEMAQQGRFKGLAPEDYYINAEGFVVFTEKYHLKRGYCCKGGCKHCPFGFKRK